jgi:hypothetical protein
MGAARLRIRSPAFQGTSWLRSPIRPVRTGKSAKLHMVGEVDLLNQGPESAMFPEQGLVELRHGFDPQSMSPHPTRIQPCPQAVRGVSRPANAPSLFEGSRPKTRHPVISDRLAPFSAAPIYPRGKSRPQADGARAKCSDGNQEARNPAISAARGRTCRKGPRPVNGPALEVGRRRAAGPSGGPAAPAGQAASPSSTGSRST